MTNIKESDITGKGQIDGGGRRNIKLGSTLMNKFNPFNKRPKGDQSVIDNTSRRYITEERKTHYGASRRCPHRIGSPYKLSKDPGESFLDLYPDTNFELLNPLQILNQLEDNKRQLIKLKDKTNNHIKDLTKRQNELEKGKTGTEVNSDANREVYEELDMWYTHQGDLDIKINSLHEIIKVLERAAENEKNLDEIKEELNNERELKRNLDNELASFKDNLPDLINEVNFALILLEIKT